MIEPKNEPIVHTPILINESYFKAYSPIPNNYDWSEIRPFVHTAEKIWVEPILGTALYEELIQQVNDNVVTPENATLLLQIYPYLSFAICFESLPFIAYHFSEVGITAGKSDNSDSISVKGINYISSTIRSQVETMKSLLKKYLNKNKDLYPTYRPEGCEADYTCEDGGICADYFWIVDYYNGGYTEHDWMYYLAISEQFRKRPNPNLQVFTTRRPFIGRR